MAHIRRLISLFVLFFFGGERILISQPIPEDSSNRAAFTVLALPGAASQMPAELYYLHGPSDGLVLRFMENRRSEMIARASAGPLVFGTRNTTGTLEKPTFTRVTEVSWPQSAKRALVLFAYTPAVAGTTGAQVKAIAIDDSIDSFPSQSVKILNFSGTALLAKVGDFEGLITTGPSSAIKYPKDKLEAVKSGKMVRFPLLLGTRKDGAATKILFSGNVDGWPDSRTLVMITPSTKNGKPGVQVSFIVEAIASEKSVALK